MFFCLVISILLFTVKNYGLMILTNGYPDSFTNSTILPYSWSDCLDYCSNTTTCMAVYNNGSYDTCVYFAVGTFQSAKRSDDHEKEFAYKINEDICPVDDSVGGWGYSVAINYTINKQVHIRYTITYDEASQSWKSNVTGAVVCPNLNGIIFARQTGGWCISSMFRSAPTNRTWVQGMCAAQKTIITGIETKEELTYIRDFAKRHLNFTNPYGGIWLDGVRKPECIGNPSCHGAQAFQFLDTTLSASLPGYIFNTNKPDTTSGDCLGYRVNPDGTIGVANFECDSSGFDTAQNVRFSGIMCGTNAVSM